MYLVGVAHVSAKVKFWMKKSPMLSTMLISPMPMRFAVHYAATPPGSAKSMHTLIMHSSERSFD